MSDNQKIVAIDLDGVLAEYHTWLGVDEIGRKTRDAETLLKKLKKEGCEVIIHTTRTNPQANPGYTTVDLGMRIATWLAEHRLSQYVTHIWTGEGKPMADLYIDDRAHYHKTNAAWSKAEIDSILCILEG
jgi:hypothetical protein